MNFAKFLRTPILQNTSGRLLLKIFEEYCTQACIRIEHLPTVLLLRQIFAGYLKSDLIIMLQL